MLKKLIFRSLKIAWALFASTVVLLAVVISVLKFSLPYADEYKSNLESFLHERFGAKVKIGYIGASWQTSGPVVLFHQVKLTPTVDAPLDIAIKEIRVELDFWQSIAQQRVVTEAFQLDGIRSRIDSSVFFKVRPKSDGNELFASLSHLFLSQVQQFKVVDSFVIVDHEDGQSQDFQVDNLTWVNQGNRHQGQGEVFVDGFSNNSLALIVDLYGQRRDDIFGQVHLEAQKMDVTPWLTQIVGNHIQLSETEANFSVWGEIQGGVIDSILLDIQNSGISWKKRKKIKYLKVDSAKVQWWKSQDDWLLFGNQVRLRTDKNIPDPFGFSLYQGLEESLLSVTNLDVTAASQLFSLFSATSRSPLLADSDISGTLEELSLSWGDELDLAGKLKIRKLGFKPEASAEEAYLGAENLELTAHLLKDRVWFDLEGLDGQLLTQDTFSEVIQYESLNLAGLVDLSPNALSVTIPILSLINEEVALKLAAQFTAPHVANGQSVPSHLDLYAEVKGPTPGKIGKYLPRHLISDNTYDYLISAIQDGRGELTRVVLSGEPAQMPYSDVEDTSQFGRFIVDADIRDAKFQFSPEWPTLAQLNANLLVDNSLMVISAQQGQLGHLTLDHDVKAKIPLDEKNTTLHLGITPKSLALADFHQLIEISPLKGLIGDVFDFVRLDGLSQAQVDIKIPLGDATGEVIVAGQVKTASASLSMPSLNLNFLNTSALVSFHNDKFEVAADSASLFGLPVSFQVKGGDLGEGYEIDADLIANWSKDQIDQLYPLPINAHFDGETTTSVKVKVNIEQDEYHYFVFGKSDLTQASYDIAQPIVKPKGQFGTLSWSVTGDNLGNEILANLDDSVYFNGLIPAGTGRIERAHLALGQDESVLPEQGFDIGLNMASLSFEPTLEFVLDILDSLPEGQSSEPGVIDAPHLVKGNIQTLNIFGQDWHNVSLNAKPTVDHWLFSVGAKETLTSVKVFDDIKQKGIRIDADFLQIVTKEDESANAPVLNLTGSDKLIAALPPITAVCKTCTFNGKPLGRVDLKAKSKGSDLIIERANFQYLKNNFEGKGTWFGDDKGGKTQISGKLTTKNFDDWLKDWGLDSGIKDSDATVNLDVNWLGAPHEFNYQHLNGTGNFKLGEGYLSEVDDKGARYLSLFSLDSLYRKLKLDFNDVFAKGLFYNDIKGDLLLENGVAHSKSIKMDGVAGDMTMAGLTDLNKKTLDYDVSFKPKLASSLPAIAAWFAPADGGLTLLAAIALDKIIDSAPVLVESKIKITGDLSDPKVEEVERFTRTIKLPETKKSGTGKPGTGNQKKPKTGSNKKDDSNP